MNVNENISIRPVLKKDLELINQWFFIPTFYFDTGNPDICSKQDIDMFLTYRSSHFCIIENNARSSGEPVALLDFMVNSYVGKLDLEFQFINYEDWIHIGTQTLAFIVNYLFQNFDINRISKLIYGFDYNAITIFKKTGFQSEGRYRSLIYKNGKYWDVFSYTFSKRDYNERFV
ncbi:MAG: GNAT family N-acetyltransferase [Spirochaetales bacterium]|nr:GNAT family N-acetyltransferase [Spirochaetales bacterium]